MSRAERHLLPAVLAAVTTLATTGCGSKPPEHARWSISPGEGRSVDYRIDFGEGGSTWKVKSTWRKSSLMPEREFTVKADPAVTSRLRAAIGKDDPPAGDLHASWFAARHLLAAGMDAEPSMNAEDVYAYYEDGLAVLGGEGSSPVWAATGEQMDLAASARAGGSHVDAVVLLRNALGSRLDDHAARLMRGIEGVMLPHQGPPSCD